MDSQERRLLQSDATTEAWELLTELLEIAYSSIKMQEEELVLLGKSVNTLLHVCALDIINYMYKGT